jgi:hypothetical protein
MVEWRIGKEADGSYRGICLEGLRKMMVTSLKIVCLWVEIRNGTPRYWAAVPWVMFEAPSCAWLCARVPAMPNRFVSKQHDRHSVFIKGTRSAYIHVIVWHSFHLLVDFQISYAIKRYIRGPFEKFVDSPYYSELELFEGTVTVSFSKYLLWQAMNFLQRSTHCMADVLMGF